MHDRRPFPGRAIAGVVALLALTHPPHSVAAPPGTRPDTPLENAQVVFSVATGMANGWQDYGWAPRKVAAGAPASLDMSSYGGWIIGNPNATYEFGGLKIKVKSPPKAPDWLELRVELASSAAFPHIEVRPKHRRDLEDGWTEVFIPLSELNPKRAPFDRMMLRAHAPLPKGTRILIEEIAWTAPDPRDAAKAERTEPIDVQMSVDCRQPGHRISPMIYGIAFKPSHDAKDSHQWRVGAGARRWGGNPTSRYNWMLGNAWNTASDWFFRNVNYTPSNSYTYELFLEDNIDHSVQTALTVPTIGWVAKDTTSVGFPASVFGEQQYMEGPNTGNGMGKNGKPLTPGPPTLTSVAAPPSFVEKWVRTIRAKDARDKRDRSVHQYILDNEPALWNSTHRDVHPEPVTYDELRDRLIKYGSAVRKADPEAVIAGPAEWGWTGYLYSAKDQAVGFQLKPDRRAHGDKPLLPWLLRELRKHREKTGERILDVVDLHYYPQHSGAGMGTTGKTDPYSAALRIRSTRSLWDPSYIDESWIGEVARESIRLIPRMKAWIAEEDPGLGISVGEWNFGAEEHMSGGLATAEALGRFAAGGVTSAFYWDYPADKSASFWAFRAFRNFDWKGGKFQDWHVPATTAYELSSVFASRNETGDRLVLVLLNTDPDGPLKARLDLSSCGTVVSSKTYSYSGDPSGFKPAPAVPRGGAAVIEQPLEAYSINVLDLQVQPAARPGRPGR